MIHLKDIKKNFGERLLFSNVSFSLTRGDHIGLVGRNGEGKSTLLQIIAGLMAYDDGQILIPKNYRIGYLKQHLIFDHKTVLEEAVSYLPDYQKDEEYIAKKILQGLGLDDIKQNLSPYSLSGGQQVRLKLACLLITESDLLLLDEPTNYLDLYAIRWLKGFLKTYPKEFILITHDQDFMNDCTNSIMGIHREKLRRTRGDTNTYYTMLAKDEEVHEKTRLNDEKKRKEIERVIERFKAKASKASMARSKQKSLDKMEVKEKLSNLRTLDFSFPFLQSESKILLKVKDLSFSYDYPRLPFLIDELSFEVKNGERLFVIGENGQGKSTLLKVLKDDLTATLGEINYAPRVTPSFYGQGAIEKLPLNSTVFQYLSSLSPQSATQTTIRKLLGVFGFFQDDAFKEISVLSGGEKARLNLSSLSLQETSLLLLDEPTQHLDIESVASLEEAIEEFPGSIICVSHDEGLIKRHATALLHFIGNGKVVYTNQDFETYLQNFEEQKLLTTDPASPISTSAPNSFPLPQSKEYKRIKSEINLEYTRLLNPLKKDYEQKEKEMYSLEEINNEIQLKLIDSSILRDKEILKDFYQTLKTNQLKIDQLLEDLACLEEKINLTKKEWGDELAHRLGSVR